MEDVPADACPQEFMCSISLDIMVNPVRLRQTGQLYDHSSFHDWISRGRYFRRLPFSLLDTFTP